MTDTLVPAPTAAAPKAAFDDVMLAMDIVDTLRHREAVALKELGVEERERALIERLREIYAAQGIDVPDRILRDGVRALEEKRFVYEPTAGGFARKLALVYVRRDRWLKPLAVVLGLAAFTTAAYEFGFDAPREARARSIQVELQQALPAALAAARDEALAEAGNDAARRRIGIAYEDGVAAVASGDVRGARAAVEDLAALKADLTADLEVRIISRPDEYSGVFRIPDDRPDARNYYLIVEAVDARGRAHALEIASEEDQATRRVRQWGVRVPEGEFNRVTADKQDDQIIQNALVGTKPKGVLEPEYSIDTLGGAILEW